MGVPGFTTYLDSNTHIFLDFRLKSTKIIVDGNNLLHFLYNLYQIPYHYGGDYTIFADTCRQFFLSLTKCLVLPYVVFDGAYDLDGKKFNSSRLRAAKKVTASLNNTKDGCAFVVPLLTQEIFKEILDELLIKHVTCNYEADDQIASLAAEWKCPVLTNDSDFFIFDLPGGVILLDYLNMAIKTDEDGAFYMDVQMYSAEKLKKVMGIHDHSLIHLFATVMGNEYIPGSTFEQFFRKLNYFSHVPGIKLNQIPNDRRKIFGLFKWFALKRNIKAAIRDIMFELNCNTDEENRIRALINKSIEKYSITNCYIHVIFNDYDEVFTSEDNFSKVDTGKLINNHNESAPVCFKMHFNQGALNSKLANIFVSQKVLLQPQIENRTDPSSHVCSSKVRELLYGLLLKSGPEGEH
ncbi:hypothetical protein HELRODRAFT_132438, partial [Helobdella robusta]|uniref:Asteroid domain-containing protein n=1 Tax=Helobdella robusta TaxID=6412 RepID=T1EHY5_HELRO